VRSLVILVGVTWLFTFPTRTLAQPPAPCLKIKQFWTSYDALRQNGNMDVKLVWNTHGCVIPTRVNGTPELSNITVAIQDISGLDAQLFHSRLNNGQSDVARELELDLYLKALSELPAGQRMFLARIDYDALYQNRIVRRERLYVPILIRVVAPNAPIRARRDWSLWRLLLLPVGILEYLGEALTGQIC
jgi:hypothetical protein